jgi:hypothetical protein
MSIEQGLVSLIQSGIGSLAPGGYAATVPETNQVTAANPKAWTYRTIISMPTYVLEGEDLLTELELQIDCHGYTMDDAILLAKAIKSALRAAAPTGGSPLVLSDPDNTVVQGIFRRAPHLDGYSDANRTYVRTLEYLVTYYDQQ